MTRLLHRDDPHRLEFEAEVVARREHAAAGSPAVVGAVYEGWPAEDLRALAQPLVGIAPCVAPLAVHR